MQFLSQQIPTRCVPAAQAETKHVKCRRSVANEKPTAGIKKRAVGQEGLKLWVYGMFPSHRKAFALQKHRWLSPGCRIPFGITPNAVVSVRENTEKSSARAIIAVLPARKT